MRQGKQYAVEERVSGRGSQPDATTEASVVHVAGARNRFSRACFKQLAHGPKPTPEG